MGDIVRKLRRRMVEVVPSNLQNMTLRIRFVYNKFL